MTASIFNYLTGDFGTGNFRITLFLLGIIISLLTKERSNVDPDLSWRAEKLPSGPAEASCLLCLLTTESAGNPSWHEDHGQGSEQEVH